MKTKINEFINHCKYEKNLSTRTIKAYSIDTSQFAKFLAARHFTGDITEISKSEIREFLAEISFLKPKSIKRKIATMKAMFNFLEFEDVITVNPFRKMRIKIQVPKTLPKVMDIKEITAILKS